ncbi:YciI family protein [bacterium]|nr:YciI family protein [bacterium]
MAHFLLLLRGGNNDLKSYSPEDLQNLLVQYEVWLDDLKESKCLLAAQKLKNDDGRFVAGKDDEVVDEGFLPEANDSVDGYVLVKAEDYDRAVVISRQCPALTHGGSVEIRELADDYATRD